MPQVPHLLFCAKLSQKLHHLDKKNCKLNSSVASPSEPGYTTIRQKVAQ